MANTKCIVNLTKEMVIAALTLAKAQRQRAANAAENTYGSDHILTQTLQQEAASFQLAATTVSDG